MNNIFSTFIVSSMLKQGCHESVASRVLSALQDQPELDNMVLWLRMQGRSYADIGDIAGIDSKHAWRIINGPIRHCIYSVLESATAMVY